MPTPSSLKESSAANLHGSNSLPLLVQDKTSSPSLPSFAKPVVAARSSIHIARTPLAKEPSFGQLRGLRGKENVAPLSKMVKDQNERVNKVGPFFSSFPATVTSTSLDPSRPSSARYPRPPPARSSNTSRTSNTIVTSQVQALPSTLQTLQKMREQKKRDKAGLMECEHKRSQELSALGELREREYQALQQLLAAQRGLVPTVATVVEAQCRYLAFVTATQRYEQLRSSMSTSASPAGPPFPPFDPSFTKYLHTLFGTLRSMSGRLGNIAMEMSSSIDDVD